MPAKKAAPKSAQSNDMAAYWKWAFVVVGLIAAIAGAINFGPLWFAVLIAVVGFVIGLFGRDTEDLKGFGIRYLLLAAVAARLDVVPAVGGYLTGFFTGFLGFMAAVGLGTLVMYFIKKYIPGM